MNRKDSEVYRAIVKMCIRLARQITDDKEALAVKILFKNLNNQIGKELKEGEYVQHGDKLFRVLKTHVVEKEKIDEELYFEIKEDDK